MKKLKTKLVGCLIAGMLCATPVWATQTPKLEVNTRELTLDTLSMKLQLENMTGSAKAIEIGFLTDDIEGIKEKNWSSELDGAYTVAKTIDKVGEEKQVTFYITAPKDQDLLGSQTQLDLGDFTFEMDLQGEMNLISGSGYLKVIDENNNATAYDKIELMHQHTPMESQPDGEDKPGGEDKPDGEDKPNGGGSGSSIGSTSKPNRPTKPEVSEKPEVPSVQFSDTTSHWASDEIGRMAGKGILKGYEDGTFGPSRQITRGEFATVMARAFGLESSAEKTPFKDVAEGKWYTDSVVSLYEKGIVNGREDGTFGVNDSITNEEMAVMIARGLEALNLELQVKREYVAFLDQDKISPFAKDAIKVLYEAEIMNGMPDGTFKPRSSATRAQVAVMMDRILSLVE